MHTASHACSHKPSATQKFATISARNLSKFRTRNPKLFCHLMLVYSALPKDVASAKETKEHQVTVGVRFSTEEFLTEAIRLCHPTEHSSLLPKDVRANIAHLSSKTTHQVAKERTEEVRRWVTLSTSLDLGVELRLV